MSIDAETSVITDTVTVKKLRKQMLRISQQMAMLTFYDRTKQKNGLLD